VLFDAVHFRKQDNRWSAVVNTTKGPQERSRIQL
jgi:hypothetical protein